MYGWDKRIFWVNYQTEATGKKIDITHIKIVLHRFWKFSMHRRNVNASFFEYITIFYNTGAPATASCTEPSRSVRPFPNILFKMGFAINFFYGLGDGILKGFYVFKIFVFYF